MMFLNINPLPFACGLDGQPLDQGYVYIGASGLDPQQNPQTVYWDAAGVFPVAQPLRTVNGRIYNAGAPAQIYVANDYSIRVLDKNGAQVVLAFSIPNLAGSGGSSLIGFIQAGFGAVLRTEQSKLRDFISAFDFGADGDGGTFDTVAVSNALATGKQIHLPTPAASYLIGAINAAASAHLYGTGVIQMSGANAGIKLNANIAGFGLDKVVAQGDGVVGNLNRLLWNDQTKTLSHISIRATWVTSAVQALDLGTVTDSMVHGCWLESSVGTAAGQGYGIVSGKSQRMTYLGSIFNNNGRTALYQSDVSYSTVVGNIFYKHAGTGTNAAHAIARGFSGVGAIGNIYAESAGIGLTVDSDALATVIGNNALISNCLFHLNVGADLLIGSQTPALTLNIKGVTVQGNSFFPTPTHVNGFITIVSGKDISVNLNHFIAGDGTAASMSAINIDSSAGDMYFDVINICGNTGRVKSTGGDSRFVNVGAEICAGVTALNIFDNQIDCDTLIAYATEPPTNPNIKTDSQFEKPRLLVAGAQAMSVAGYNNFVYTGDAGASSVSDFTNGYEGKTIRLRFVDALVTITEGATIKLAGGANFTGSNFDWLELTKIGATWIERNRSVNS